MKNLSIHQVMIGMALTLSSMLAQAQIMQVDFSYTPDNAPSTPKLTGQFTYDTTNVGPGNIVNANELKSFSFTLTNNVMSVTTDLALLQAQQPGQAFVFGYDTVSNTFAFGGGQQSWYNASAEAPGTQFGILSGRGGSVVSMRLSTSVNGNFLIATNTKQVSAAENLFTYTVTPVPEPESVAMLLAGLGLVGVMVRRRRG